MRAQTDGAAACLLCETGAGRERRSPGHTALDTHMDIHHLRVLLMRRPQVAALGLAWI
jgi:hypothetical protein